MTMGAALIISVGVARGVHPLGIALLGGTLLRPEWALLGIAGLVMWARRRQRHEALVGGRRFFERVSAELMAGQPLRVGLIEGVMTLPRDVATPIRRRLETGRDLGGIGEELARSLPLAGRSLMAAIAVAARGGGAVSPVFAELGHDVAEEVELLRERRVLTTQARATTMLVGGAPLVFFGYQLVTGALAERFSTPYGVLLTVVGGLLVLIGVVAVGMQLRRT